MKSQAVLRRRDLFRQVSQNGTRLDSGFLRCTYLCRPEGNEVFQVAFKVPSRRLNAVHRNRIRRLMRSAFDKERRILDALVQTHQQLFLFITFNASKAIPVERMKLVHMSRAMEELYRRIVRSVTSEERESQPR